MWKKKYTAWCLLGSVAISFWQNMDFLYLWAWGCKTFFLHSALLSTKFILLIHVYCIWKWLLHSGLHFIIYSTVVLKLSSVKQEKGSKCQTLSIYQKFHGQADSWVLARFITSGPGQIDAPHKWRQCWSMSEWSSVIIPSSFIFSRFLFDLWP